MIDQSSRSQPLALVLRTSLAFGLVASLAFSAACRSSDEPPVGDDDDVDAGPNDPDGSPPVEDAKIQDIQGSIPVGTSVSLRGVVVVAVDRFGVNKGRFFVMEPEGGAYSGILVYGADLSAVDDLVVGDLVDIEGATKDEFALTEDTSGRTTTELVPAEGGAISVVKVGDGTVPAAEVVDALEIGQLATPEARDAEWEKWEGVLITVQNVAIIKGTRFIDEKDDPTFQEFQVTGPLRVDSSLAALPEEVTVGACLTSVTGIGDYFFNYKVLIRSTDDVVAEGTSCPVQEEGAQACAGGVDDDADGFADCADFSCQDSVVECVPEGEETTIAEVQGGTATGLVELKSVIVTGVTFNKSNFWVADAATAAPLQGVFVFRGGASVDDVPAGVVIGATLDVTGTPIEDGAYTQLTGPSLQVVDAPLVTPVPVAVPLASLNDATLAEPYEGVLVELTGPFTVSNVVAQDFDFYFTLNSGASNIVVDDDVFRLTPAANDCFSRVVGIFHYNRFDSRTALIPRSAADFTACP